MRLAALLLTVLCAAPMLACESETTYSNVLGEECPELLLEEEMVQGEPITWDSLSGKAVLFLFYQRECEGCERYAMPRIQKMHEKWAGSHCWLVFVINTAFDKDIYPHLADVSETRKHLTRMDWTMPVARDLDEQSNALFTLEEQSGTPQAIVMDEHGIVRAHDWYSEEKEMDAVDKVFEDIASSMNCKCVRMPREMAGGCKGAREAFKEGKYREAFDKAQEILDGNGYDKQDKADADYLQDYIDDIVETRIERIERHFDRDPEAALARAEEAIVDFDGVARIKDFGATVEGWYGSDHLANFRTGRKDLAKLEGELSKAGAEIDDDHRKAFVDRLTKIADRAGKTVVADSARQHIDRLSSAAAIGQADVSGAKAGRSGESSGGATGSNRIGSSSGGGSGISKKTGSATPAAGTGSEPARGGTSSELSRHRNVRKSR